MKPRDITLAMILISMGFLALTFLTGCAGLGSPQVSVRTDYGTFSYELPKPTSSK